MATILDEIIEYKRLFVMNQKAKRPFMNIKRLSMDTQPPHDFAGALVNSLRIALIAEVKKASPSKGIIRGDFDPVQIATTYEMNGAQAISVLTDERYFQGSDAYLTKIRRCVNLPILRKDFTIDPYQIYEARAIGADAILLITAILEREEIVEFLGIAKDLGMASLVEVHSVAELEIALDVGATLIGINNRDLRTFKTALETTFELVRLIPGGRIIVSESGINRREDVRRLQEVGVDAILVGEALMREQDVGAKIREFMNDEGEE